MSPLIRKDRIWPTIIVVVLGGYVTFGIIAARIATHDPNFAVESDYYGKAVRWDSTLAQNRRNIALGWHIAPTLGAVGRGHAARLELDVRDSAGARVEDAQVSIEMRQVAHASDVVRATLRPDSAGDYAADLPLGRAGLWEMRLVATRGSDRFDTSLRMDASESANASIIDSRPGDPLAASTKAGMRREDASPRPKHDSR